MRKFRLQAGLLLALTASFAAGCSSEPEMVVVENGPATTGTAALALSIPPDLTVNSVVAHLTFPSKKTQEHTINVQPSGSTATIYFRLPVGNNYSIQLKADASRPNSSETLRCKSEPVAFNVSLNTETPVAVPIVCTVPGGSTSGPSGSA